MIGQKIYLLVPNYSKCVLKYDEYGNSETMNGELYCDLIKDKNYCIYKCRSGYDGFHVAEKTIAKQISENVVETTDGTRVQLEHEVLTYSTIGVSAFWSAEEAEERKAKLFQGMRKVDG